MYFSHRGPEVVSPEVGQDTITIRQHFIVRASLKFVLHPSSSIYKHHRQDKDIRTGHQKQDNKTGLIKKIYIQHNIMTTSKAHRRAFEPGMRCLIQFED